MTAPTNLVLGPKVDSILLTVSGTEGAHFRSHASDHAHQYCVDCEDYRPIWYFSNKWRDRQDGVVRLTPRCKPHQLIYREETKQKGTQAEFEQSEQEFLIHMRNLIDTRLGLR